MHWRCWSRPSTPVVGCAQRNQVRWQRPRSVSRRRSDYLETLGGNGGSAMKTAPHRTLRVVLPILATAAIVVPLTWMWLASRMPSAYSVMSMGYPDYGGVQPSFAEHPEHQSGHGSMPSRSITELIADPARAADVRVNLVAQQQPS